MVWGVVDGQVRELGRAGGRCVIGGGLACETENRAHRARFRLDLQERGKGWMGGLVRCHGWASERARGAGGRYAREGGGLAHETENRALWARFWLDLQGRG